MIVGFALGSSCDDQSADSVIPIAFNVATPLLVSRQDAATAMLHDGKVLIVSGADSANVLQSSAEVFDPATSSIRLTKCGLAVARRHARAATLSDGRVIVLGGDPANLFTLLQTEIYDPATDCFTNGPQLLNHRTVEGAVLLQDGRLLVVQGPPLDPSLTNAGAELLDATGTQFRSVNRDLGAETDQVSATLLRDGRVLFAGGTQVGQNRLAFLTARAVIFDPATDSSRVVGSLITPREFHATAVLPDGRVLIIGGGSGVAISSIEAFDPTTEAFAAAPFQLATRRLLATSVVFDGGVVLVIGGTSRLADPSLTTSEWLITGANTGSSGPDFPLSVGVGHTTFQLPDGRLAVVRQEGDPPSDHRGVVLLSVSK